MTRWSLTPRPRCAIFNTVPKTANLRYGMMPVLRLATERRRWTMTERITPGQKKQLTRFAEDAVGGVDIPKDGAQRVIAQGGVFQRRLAALVCELAMVYFFLLSDEEAHEWLRRNARKKDQEAKRHILGYRRGAQEHEVADTEPCHVQVVSGATLKETIPTVGPCVDDFRYLQDWRFPDPPTTDSMFSLVPKLLRDSIRKNMDEQRELLAQVRQRLELPDNGNHLTGFGAVTHLAGAVLTYKVVGRDIFAGKIVHTETCDSGGYRLGLYWNGGRLGCGYWYFDEGRYDDVGVLACGVEKALGR